MSVDDVFREKARLAEYYDRNIGGMEQLGRTIAEAILPRALREYKGVTFTYRVKEKGKAISKIERKYYDAVASGRAFEEYFPDLVGVRVICLYEDDVMQIVSTIKTTFDCNEIHYSDKYMLNDEEPEKFGYRAVHCVGRLGSDRRKLEEYSTMPDCLFEIQVRTIIQDAWANLSHRAYHTPPPPILRRKIAVIAALLELSDREFVAIRKEAYQK